MKGGGVYITDIPFFVSGLPTNYQHSLPEGRGLKNSLNMKHWSSKILTMSPLMGLHFFPINSFIKRHSKTLPQIQNW